MRVETRTTGRRRRDAWEVDVVGRLALRELVERLVAEEVTAYEQRRTERLLVRTLTPADVERGVAEGRVDSGGRRVHAAPEVEEAVATALEAFGDGLWFVFVDGTQLTSLDEVVEVGPDTDVRFVRLVALAGG